uniref:Uncharacterized protein n=1 Tax=Arundo donax TaxID=35708 RepID=A0A0A8YSG2_ARUDO
MRAVRIDNPIEPSQPLTSS